MGDEANRCHFVVRHKHRPCRLPTKRGHLFCGEHAQFENANNQFRKRIPCPCDKNHTVFEDELADHLTRCNSRLDKNANEAWFSANVNVDQTHISSGTTSGKLEELEDMQLLMLVSKVEYVLRGLSVQDAVVDDFCSHPFIDDFLSNPGLGETSRKHLIQQGSILGHLEKLGMITKGSCYIEFGAGKAKLTHKLCELVSYRDIANCSYVLIERKGQRRKAENKAIQYDSSLQFLRTRSPIEHVDLSKLEFLQRAQSIVCLSKHLCGEGTDVALRCIVNATQKDDLMPKLRTILFAPCCHHLCSWSQCLSRSFFEQNGLSESDFAVILAMTSWATCGMQLTKDESLGTRNHVLSTERRIEVGFMCKKLVDFSRIHYLRQHGWNARLVNFVPTVLQVSGVPSHFWETLYEKLQAEVFDAGSYFLMSPQSPDEEHRSALKLVVSADDGISALDGSAIFLVDHAWTYRVGDARKDLERWPNLLDRMCTLMGVNQDDQSERVEAVLTEMWKYNQTYSVNAAGLDTEDCLPVFYVPDEVGIYIQHSDTPNCRLTPFYYESTQCAFSLLFPIQDIATGETVTRDFVEGALYHNDEWRQYYLLPWRNVDFSSSDCRFIIASDSFFMANRNNEILPDHDIPCNMPTKLRVYSEYEKIATFLTYPAFEVVDNADEADILWPCSHFKDYRKLLQDNPDRMINQFPYESTLTVKDLFAACVHNSFSEATFDDGTMECAPAWLPITYNLKTELPQFVAHYQRRQKLGLDNHWLVKPWNLARSMDMYLTDRLDCVVRLVETGPKIACKYIEDPVLFRRQDTGLLVKFDIRYIVLIASVQPLKAYVYDRFWLRFGQKSFALDRLDDYEQHFTVFNYLDKSKILQMFSRDFVEQFEQQYPMHRWHVVQEAVNAALRESVASACREAPPRGMMQLSQCRAMYGVDVMLRWQRDTAPNKDDSSNRIQPVVLEYNFLPDCARACDYYPDFMNTVFRTLFLQESTSELPVTLL